MLVATETKSYTKTRYAKDFKDMCIREMMSSDEKMKDLAERLGVKATTLKNWKWAYKSKMREKKNEITKSPAPPKDPITAEKLAALIEENRHLKALLKLYM